MKRINIFVGSSIIELEKERQDFSEIINDLNVKLQNADIVFYLHKCENVSGNMLHSSTQELIDNTMILNSDYSYFIIKTFFHQWTKHEFEIAYDSFVKNGKPLISVMFCKLDDTKQLSQEAIDFQNKLQDMGYYYKQYRNSEELKLNIVLNIIVDDLLSGKELTVEDDGLYFGDIKIIDMNQITSYNNHIELGRLQHQLAKLEKEESTCEDKRERRLLREQIHEINVSIHEIESLIYQTMLNLTKVSRDGLTPLLKRAIHFIENGEIEKAAEILNIDDVNMELDSYIEKTDLSLKGVQSAIETAFIAVETMLQLPITFERSLEIERLFQKIISLETNYNLNRYHYGLYVRYLLNQHKYDNAIKYAWLYLECADIKIDLKESFSDTEYSLLGMVLTLEPLCKSDPERFVKLYISAYYRYIKILEKAVKTFSNDINISVYSLGINCDRLMEFIRTMDYNKDDDILCIEEDLIFILKKLKKEGYRKVVQVGQIGEVDQVDSSESDGERDAQRLIDQIELQNVFDKMNQEPDTDDPTDYLTEYLKTLEDILRFFETSNNMYIQNNPVKERFLLEYEQIKSAIDSQDNDTIVMFFVQCKIAHAKHFLNAANYDASIHDFETAYKILFELKDLDTFNAFLFCDTCFGYSNTLIAKIRALQTKSDSTERIKQCENLAKKAENISYEGVKQCERLAEKDDQYQLLLAKLYTNHAHITMVGRTKNCMVKGIDYSNKALSIFELRRNNLSPSECIDALKSCYLYALVLIENGKNEDALSRLLCGIGFLHSSDESTQIRERKLINSVILETIKTAAKNNKLDETISKLTDKLDPETVNKLLQELEFDE